MDVDDRRSREVVERARPIGPSDRVLDLGGGVAPLLRERLGAAARIECVDTAPLAFADASFELVLCRRLLSGPDLIGVLREVQRVLSPGGRLIASTPSAEEPFERAQLEEGLLAIGFIDVRIEGTVVSARRASDNSTKGPTWRL